METANSEAKTETEGRYLRIKGPRLDSSGLKNVLTNNNHLQNTKRVLFNRKNQVKSIELQFQARYSGYLINGKVQVVYLCFIF